MLNEFEQFLIDNKFLPLNKGEKRWCSFKIEHKEPKNNNELVSTKNYIRNEVSNKNGLYIYKNSMGQILYVGKAKPLINRLYSHYKESFQEVLGDTKDKRWHRFFYLYQGELEVYWCELEDEHCRQIVEKMLDVVLKPIFNWENQSISLGKTSTTFTSTKLISNTQNQKEKYQFLNHSNELIDKVQTILGSGFQPQFNKTGVTFFGVKGRVLKLVSSPNKIKVEFNVPVSVVSGLTVLTETEAKAKKMGTCQWIYQGTSLDMVLKLIEEAVNNY
ncbi:GIY-YIG nuclease family protein [Aneurinibacillus uraniidurans]|uniref:GIY-YIG nuclease family protein n=1 Tax=Aneurinibacillus uraniidurans TaxID=2966586 RepID=UPI00234B7CAF|nr:hypothetical protein [Aneurinibacillus sp. B1]WCN36479.1 hypothetical protein PO771_11355 [Aneurinibacillus sp. B1]